MAGKTTDSPLQQALAGLQSEGDVVRLKLGNPLLDGLAKAMQDPSARPASHRRIWDTEVPKLYLRVMTTGVMSFGVQWSRRGAKTLGKYPTVTLEGARRQATAALANAAAAPDGVPEIAKPAPVADTLTLSQFVEKHYRPHAKKHLTHGEADADRILRVLHKHKGKPLSALSKKDLQSALTARDVEPATLARDRNTIRAALNLAIEWELLEANPAVGLETGKVKEGVTRYLSADEERALLAALEERDEAAREARARTMAVGRKQHAKLSAIGTDEYPDHLTPLVLVALNTGCRRGELFKLRWADVRLTGKHPQLTVGGATAKSGKTRHVPLNAKAVDALARWRGQNPDAAKVFGLVDVKKAWAGVLVAAKIKDFRFHDLRHTFASKLVQRGVPLNTVRELLGHADIKMTLRYAHLAPENKAAAVALLDRDEAHDNVIQFPAKAG